MDNNLGIKNKIKSTITYIAWAKKNNFIYMDNNEMIIKFLEPIAVLLNKFKFPKWWYINE